MSARRTVPNALDTSMRMSALPSLYSWRTWWMNREPAMDCHMPLSENALDEMVARERERGAPPLTDWDSLAVRLRAEGLIHEPVIERFTSRRWMQIAAGLALTIGGAAAGRMSAGAPVLPVEQASQPSPDGEAA